MERIKVFKVRKEVNRFFIVFGIVFTILGIVLFIKALIDGFNPHFPGGDWSTVLFIIQGPFFILMGYFNLRSNKYFLEWDDNEIRYLLPESKKVEKLLFADIKQVRVKLFEIEFILSGNSRILNLENLQFEDLKKIKARFERLM